MNKVVENCIEHNKAFILEINKITHYVFCVVGIHAYVVKS